jgi:hypothetical protein
VGLAVALGCPVEAPVYITDMEDMVALMQHNVILNQVEDRVIPLILNWFLLLVHSSIVSDLTFPGVDHYHKLW